MLRQPAWQLFAIFIVVCSYSFCLFLDKNQLLEIAKANAAAMCANAGTFMYRVVLTIYSSELYIASHCYFLGMHQTRYRYWVSVSSKSTGKYLLRFVSWRFAHVVTSSIKSTVPSTSFCSCSHHDGSLVQHRLSDLTAPSGLRDQPAGPCWGSSKYWLGSGGSEEEAITEGQQHEHQGVYRCESARLKNAWIIRF